MTPRSLTRRFQDACIGMCGLGVVVAGVTAIDGSCRRFIWETLHGEFPPIPAGVHVHALAKHVTDFMPSGNPSLLAFGAVAALLGVVMFKT
jgi:hypothetical protein